VLYNLLGATAGATLAFLVARYLASGWIRRKAGGRLKRIIEGVEAEGWRFVAFVRLVPLFPFNLLNYALGLTRIRLFDYVFASLVCMAPGTIAYTYLGYAGRETVVGGEALALGLLSFAAFLPRVVRRFRSTSFKWVDAGWLRSRVATGEAPVIVDVRGRDEFVGDLGHLEGARNIPITELPGRISQLDPFRTREIVLVCPTQMRSARAATALTEAGFRDVAVLRGGMLEWSRQGLPVDQG
jgi:rhodanese-related sulfurtransferase